MAASGVVISGKGSLRVDGKVYNCSSITPRLGSETREAVVGFSGVAGYKVTPVAPGLTATVIVTPDVSVATLQATTNKTVEVQMADGRAYVFEGATQKNQLEHSAEDGTTDVEFDAFSGTEA